MPRDLQVIINLFTTNCATETLAKIRNMAPRKTKKQRIVDESIIGRLLSVEYPTTTKEKDKWYDALVVGYQSERHLHKIFYMVEGSTEAVDLRERSWKFLSKKEVDKYGNNPMLFKRMAVTLAVGFLHEEMRKIPFEAFVVREFDDGAVELFYTLSNHVENRKLVEKDKKQWYQLRQYEMELNYNPLVTWSFYPEHVLPIA